MSKNIVLVGLMGSGKTTIGKLLSKTLERELIDIDSKIEKESGKTINEIFELYGELLFRKLESKAIDSIGQEEDKVISTGGGAVQDNCNLDNLKKNGLLFYLKASPKELFARIKHDTHRPLLKNAKPQETLKKLLKQREGNYNLADYTITTDNKQANDIVNEIIEKYKNHEFTDCKC